MSRVLKASSLSSSLHKKILLSASPVMMPPVHRPDQTEEMEDPRVADAENKSEEILRQARETADQWMAEAQERIARMEAEAKNKLAEWWNEKEREAKDLFEQEKKAGYESGFAAGKEEAVSQIQKEYRELIEKAEQVLRLAEREKEKIIQESEPELLELSVAIAEKVLHKEVETNREVVLHIIEEMLQKVKESSAVDIYVHPDDYEMVLAAKSRLLEWVDGKTELQVYPDHSLSSSGCLIKTPSGSMDARIDKQLEEVRKHLLNHVRDEDSYE